MQQVLRAKKEKQQNTKALFSKCWPIAGWHHKTITKNIIFGTFSFESRQPLCLLLTLAPCNYHHHTIEQKGGVGAAQHFPKINFGTFVFQSLKPFSFLTYLGTLDRVVGGKKSNPQVQTRPQSGNPSSNNTHGRVLLTHST